MMQDLDYSLLDLLVDGPTSFAALFGSLIRNCGYDHTLSVDLVMDALSMMEKRGWIRSRKMNSQGTFCIPTNDDYIVAREKYRVWLFEAKQEDILLDEVGMWYEIEFKGQTAWQDWSNEERRVNRGLWALDDIDESKTICIHAESISVAEDALCDWIALNPHIEIIEESKSIESLNKFNLNNGATIENGVKLVCKYK